MKNLKDYVIFGGLYSYSHARFNKDAYDCSNDQIYHLAVPFIDKSGNLGFQDTYQISYPSGIAYQKRYENQLERFKSWSNPNSGQYATYDASSYYCKGNEIIKNESMLNDYKLICDLNDFEVLDASKDKGDYNQTDIIDHIFLWHECNYPNGLTLVRKNVYPDSRIQFNNQVNRLLNKLPYSLFGNFDAHDKQMLSSLVDKSDNIKIPYRTQKKFEKLCSLFATLDNFENAYKANKADLDSRVSFIWNYENSSKYRLKDIHLDIERYLKYDCYCPNEVYDATGLSYQLFYPETPIKLFHMEISETETSYYAIAKGENEYYPQILAIDTFGNKCKSIIRYDVTNENIQHIMKNESHNFNPSVYAQIIFEEKLNSLIDSLENYS